MNGSKYNFTLPNYKGGSIINLMSSISNNFGKKHQYEELSALKSEELKKFKNIIFIVVDGLGYNYLQKQKGSFLLENPRASMTSTFLSTTACANTAFHTGYPPQQHALTGWDINLKEVGAITTILPFVPLFAGGVSLEDCGFTMEKVMDIEQFHKGFRCKSFTLIEKDLSDTQFTRYASGGTSIIPTLGYKNAFTKIKQLLRKKSFKRRLIHAYLPELDTATHHHGVKSRKVREVFDEMDKLVKNLARSIRGTSTRLIVVSDHGLINNPKERELWVENFPGLKQCLTIPIAGEPRVRDCFVRPSKVRDFERITRRFSKYWWCYKGSQLIKDNFYGLGKPNPKLLDRVGDYVLIMKENYILREKLANYKPSGEFHEGKHGGVTADEMFVPLISISG